MDVRFLTIAEQEVEDAYGWFEGRTEGKGVEFLDELDRVVRLIRSFPFAALEIEPEIRRSLLERFPYMVVYVLEHQTIVVVAVAHTRTTPHVIGLIE